MLFKFKKHQGDDAPAPDSTKKGELYNQSKFPNWRQIKYLPKFLSKQEKIIFYAALIIIIASLGAIMYIFINEHLALKPAVGGTYTESVVGSPQYINPLYAQANEIDKDLCKLLFAGLIKIDTDGQIQNDLAKEWSVDAETGTKYTFLLRDDIYWPDEKQFTAEDVLFTFEAIKNQSFGSPLRNSWTAIKIETKDNFTVEFTLPEKFPAFIYSMDISILPAHIWQDVLPSNATLAELNLKPVGLGPYKFKSLTKDKQGFIKSYTLIRNENYHLHKSYLEEITFKFYPTFEMSIESLKNKNADGVSFLPSYLKQELSTRKDLNYHTLSLPQYTAIFFNQNKNTLLENDNIRLALQAGLNKQEIIESVLEGQGQVISNPILQNIPGFQNSSSTLDKNLSLELLLKENWDYKEIKPEIADQTNSENTVNNTSTEEIPPVMSEFRFKGDTELTIKLTVANQPLSIATAEQIKKQWQALGIRTELEIKDISEIQNQIIPTRNYEALLFGEIYGVDRDSYPFWHSSQADGKGLNLANFKSKDADEFIEAARQTNDYDIKARSYAAFAQIIEKEIPAIFLYSPNYIYPVSSKIKGLSVSHIISPSDRLVDLPNWYIKTKKGWQ